MINLDDKTVQKLWDSGSDKRSDYQHRANYYNGKHAILKRK